MLCRPASRASLAVIMSMMCLTSLPIPEKPIYNPLILVFVAGLSPRGDLFTVGVTPTVIISSILFSMGVTSSYYVSKVSVIVNLRRKAEKIQFIFRVSSSPIRW